MEYSCRECRGLTSRIMEAISEMYGSSSEMFHLSNDPHKVTEQPKQLQKLKENVLRNKAKAEAFQEALAFHQECCH